MPTADDGTQTRIFQRIEEAGIPEREIAEWLGVSPQVVSDYKALRRTLPPWGLKRIARRMGTSSAVALEIVRAGGEEICRAPDVEGIVDALGAATEAMVHLGEFTEEALAAANPASPGGRRYTPAERLRLQERLAPLRRLLADADRALAAPVIRSAG